MHLEVINPVCDLSPQSASIVYINFLDRTSLFYQKLKKARGFLYSLVVNMFLFFVFKGGGHQNNNLACFVSYFNIIRTF